MAATELDMSKTETHSYAIFSLKQQTAFTDHLLHRVWVQLEYDNLVRVLFYDGHIIIYDDFFKFMRRDGMMPFVILKEADLVGLWWLNNFKNRTAQIHFSAFKSSMGCRRKAPHFGNKSIRYALCLQDDKGYLIDKVLGVTPETYRLALKYNERAGMIEYGREPLACNLVYEDRLVDGILTYATRDTMGLAEGKLETNLWVE